ncbi:serine/threonine-protein kinase [Polyangium aurulentum]|uniref:serine/threonine-protein kinase n=1 Tax=Polyangium aurulentum TaxID=2567896 RepID=UPI0010ADE15B|nr:serine/threonine-protein kinase [Polyangium aurulentum]UQA58637.1 serine/threonine protein kinase [Polyangium aurulentum]
MSEEKKGRVGEGAPLDSLVPSAARVSVRPVSIEMAADGGQETVMATESAIADRPSKRQTVQPEGAEEQRGAHVGRVLSGKYALVACIGAGGMGEVYRGEHLSLRVPIAVKLLHRRIAMERDYVRRFEREAHAASLLAHPNVVRVLDFGQDAGIHYIVMEYLEGQSLHAWLKDHATPPPLLEVRDVMLQLLDAFEIAHARGIVHRDLKPENVFLTDVGGRRTVKILDFGLAHVEVPKEAGPTLTQPDAVAGTPEYMSPEQCHSLAVGPSSDLYSIGCVLTALLQGRPPFAGRNSIEVISAHLFLPPPPLARPEGSEPVPQLVEKLRLELLSKQPERRPADVKEVRQRLLDALDPASLATQLATRKGNEPLGGRGTRAPQWDGAKERQADSTEPARDGVSRVAWLKLPGAAGVDRQCLTGLAAQKIHLKPIDAIEAIASTGLPVALIDAGSDVEGAAAALAALAKAAPSIRAVVCAAGLSTERMNRLVAAGAADVASAPASPDALAKKLARVLRRGR